MRLWILAFIHHKRGGAGIFCDSRHCRGVKARRNRLYMVRTHNQFQAHR